MNGYLTLGATVNILATAPHLALLVEDEALVAMVAEDQLHNLGFEVMASSTGAGARQLMSESPARFTLAVVDIGLPDMRGDDLTAQLRQMSPLLKIVVASGYDAETLRRQFGSDNNIALISKPYSEDDLVMAVRALGFDGERAGVSE